MIYQLVLKFFENSKILESPGIRFEFHQCLLNQIMIRSLWFISYESHIYFTMTHHIWFIIILLMTHHIWLIITLLDLNLHQYFCPIFYVNYCIRVWKIESSFAWSVDAEMGQIWSPCIHLSVRSSFSEVFWNEKTSIKSLLWDQN